MNASIPARPHGARPLPESGPTQNDARFRERLAWIAELGPEQFTIAMAFLAAYLPRVFDVILTAIEPATQNDPAVDQEPICLLCGNPVGVFLAHGPEYRHYRGIVTATSKPKPYRADHSPVVGWRQVASAA